MNEGTIIALTYILFCFSDYVSSAQIRSNLGLVYIFLSLFNVCVHLVIMLCHSLFTAKKAYKKRALLKRRLQLKNNKVVPEDATVSDIDISNNSV